MIVNGVLCCLPLLQYNWNASSHRQVVSNLMNNILQFIFLTLGLYSSFAHADLCTAPSGKKCLYVLAGNRTVKDGASWSTAWNELSEINWAYINSGDVILIGKGSYASILNLSKAGDSATDRIRIERATESGFGGAVVIPGISVSQPYLTVDGKTDTATRSLFTITEPGGSTLINVSIPITTDYFEIKNAYIKGTPSTSCDNKFINAVSGSINIDFSTLDGSQCKEDMIWWYSSGKLKIEHSYITKWLALCPTSTFDPITCTHSDFCWMTGNGESLIFRYNLVDDYYPAGGKVGSMWAFGNQNVFTKDGNNSNARGFIFREFAYNVFKNTSQINQGTASSGVISNNVFYKTGLMSWTGIGTFTNNIFSNPREGSMVWSCADRNSLYGPGVAAGDKCTVAANKDISGDPLFYNPESILGSDGVPFTSDDGFIIPSTSPARDNGLSVGYSVDIRGVTLSGLPDIGAYEAGGAAPPTPGAPTNLRIQ